MKRILQLFSAKTLLFEILVYQPEYYGRWPQETLGCLMLIRFPSVNKTNGRYLGVGLFQLITLFCKVWGTLYRKRQSSVRLWSERLWSVPRLYRIHEQVNIHHCTLSSFWSQVLFLLFYKLALFGLPHNSYNLLSLSRNNVLEIFFHNE